MESTPVALHLTGGVRLETEVDAPADLEDDELLARVRDDIGPRQDTPLRIIGGVLFRIDALLGIELL